MHSLRNTPRPGRLPTQQLLVGPVGGLVCVARRAGVWHLVLVSHGRRDELERMRADEGAGDALGLDLWHMAGDTLAAGAAVLMVGVLFETRRARSLGGGRNMTA